MVTSLRLRNFKAFQDSKAFPIRPLTCIVGRNSSGKSTVAQALLILRQSQEQRTASLGVPRLVLNGSLVEAGTYGDVVYQHDSTQTISVEFGLAPDRRQPKSKEPESIVDFPTDEPGSRFGVLRRYGFYRRASAQSREVTVGFEFSPHETYGPTLSTLEIEVARIGRARFTRTVEGKRRDHWRVYTAGMPPKASEVLFAPGDLVPWLNRRSDVYREATPRSRRQINLFHSEAHSAMRRIDMFLAGIRFLGPFRTPPERRYVFSGFGTPDTGPSGKSAIDLLIAESLLRPKLDRRLTIEVSSWLRRMRLASRIEIRDLARRSNLFEVRLANAGHARSAGFPDVGFGISQVLPVLVQGLLTPIGGTFVVQQPELHLHPDAQSELADFFLYLCSRGVNCIVETHSEYFLVRVRRRLAEAARIEEKRPGGEAERRTLANQIAIVIAEEKKEAGSTLTELRINDGFQFDNLPKGFMSAAVDDRLRLLRALSRAG